MKREGRQHGTVRTLCILPPSPLNPNKPAQKKSTPLIGSPPTAGIFTRVPTKPTNHSKFTGKCGRSRCSDCHLHPARKSKDKIKGARKHWSYDVELGYGGLIACRVGPNPNYTLKWDSCSASEIFNELKGYDYEDNYDHYFSKYDDYDRHNPITLQGLKLVNWSTNLESLTEYPSLPNTVNRISLEINEEDDNGTDDGFRDIIVIGNDDDDMGFYDVAIVWEPIDGDEGWSLIGEM